MGSARGSARPNEYDSDSESAAPALKSSLKFNTRLTIIDEEKTIKKVKIDIGALGAELSEISTPHQNDSDGWNDSNDGSIVNMHTKKKSNVNNMDWYFD